MTVELQDSHQFLLLTPGPTSDKTAVSDYEHCLDMLVIDVKKLGPVLFVVVVSEAGVGWFMYVHSFGTCYSMSIFLRQYPTNRQGVRSYPDLATGAIGEEYDSFIDVKSLADVTIE